MLSEAISDNKDTYHVHKIVISYNIQLNLSKRTTMGPTLNGPFREVIGLGSQNIVMAIIQDPIGEWSICGGGQLERYFCTANYNMYEVVIYNVHYIVVMYVPKAVATYNKIVIYATHTFFSIYYTCKVVASYAEGTQHFSL